MRCVVLTVIMASAIATAQESALHADFRLWSGRVGEACGTLAFKTIESCPYTLFTDHPLHIAVGSIAPQNGIGFGPAFVTHYTPNESWRLTWNFDAIGSTNASWRAGGYMKIIHTPPVKIVVKPAPTKPGEKPTKPKLAVHPYTVFNVFAQSISLNKLYFFGLGPDTLPAGRSVFGEQQTIVGGNVIKPITEWSAIRGLNLALLGEVNGRFVSLRGNHGESSPSIEQLYNEATAPGLTTQPAFVQLGEGVRLKPTLFNDHLQLNYLGTFQQFFAPSASRYSFRRWGVDLTQTVPLYSQTQSSGAKDFNGPNECAQTVGGNCPPIVSRNRSGAVAFRFVLSESATSTPSVVPFYLQPTLGGTNINGFPALSSYQDYRFRGPNLILFRESFEHSIWGPFGFSFMADQGKVALTRGDIGFDNLKHSFSAGLTLRAGGFPEVSVMYAWGGGEGQHTTFNLNTSLLGGGGRPSLY